MCPCKKANGADGILSCIEVLPAGRWRRSFTAHPSPCPRHCWNLTLKPVLSFGPLTRRKTLGCWSTFREGQRSWWRASGTNIVRNSQGNWGGTDWRKGGLGDTLSLSTTAWKVFVVRHGFFYFSQVASERTGGSSLKLCRRRFKMEITNIFFTGRTIRHWNRPPREVAGSSFLEVLKMCVGVALRVMF